MVFLIVHTKLCSFLKFQKLDMLYIIGQKVPDTRVAVPSREWFSGSQIPTSQVSLSMLLVYCKGGGDKTKLYLFFNFHNIMARHMYYSTTSTYNTTSLFLIV
jgi:hypothetical protein